MFRPVATCGTFRFDISTRSEVRSKILRGEDDGSHAIPGIQDALPGPVFRSTDVDPHLKGFSPNRLAPVEFTGNNWKHGIQPSKYGCSLQFMAFCVARYPQSWWGFVVSLISVRHTASIMTQGIFSISFSIHDLFLMCFAVAGNG